MGICFITHDVIEKGAEMIVSKIKTGENSIDRTFLHWSRSGRYVGYGSAIAQMRPGLKRMNREEEPHEPSSSETSSTLGKRGVSELPRKHPELH